MKLDYFAKFHRISGSFIVFASLLTSCAAAHAQWTASDAQTAFNDFNSPFYYKSGDPNANDYYYRTSQSGGSLGFWNKAEETEMAEDAYVLNPTTANQTIVNNLCAGFEYEYTSNWSSDGYDDDLLWATIAFVRGYQETGNTQWLNDAETNFATVWSRGYDSADGGIWWDTPADNNRVSASNWTFVIAGKLLYNVTGNATYKTEAQTIYNWSMSNLYVASTGQVYDGVKSSGPDKAELTYNYGTAIGATYFMGDFTDANKMATYMITNLADGTYGGYNIMPNYGQGGSDGAGFNGIALRWTGFAYARQAISNTAVLAWAQTNVAHAWSLRNSAGLSWNNWADATPNGTNLYSWDTSDTVVGMQVIPVSSSTLIANGTYVITNVNSGKDVEDPGSSNTKGQDMDQYTVNDHPNQQWTINNLGNNIITLTNVYSGQLLDVAGVSLSNGALVDQYPANGNTNQKWQVTSVGSGVYTLTSVSSGLVLEVGGGSKLNQAKVDQWPYQGNTWQQWTFTNY